MGGIFAVESCGKRQAALGPVRVTCKAKLDDNPMSFPLKLAMCGPWKSSPKKNALSRHLSMRQLRTDLNVFLDNEGDRSRVFMCQFVRSPLLSFPVET